MTRGRVLSVRLTDVEHALLERRAADRGCPVSDLVRAAIRGARMARPATDLTHTVAASESLIVWHDGTVGGTWPPSASS